MNDRPNSATSAAAAEAVGVHLPNQSRGGLPTPVRLHLADLASVPDERREEFYDVIQMPVRLVWELDRRALGTEPRKPLLRAAAAARALHEAFNELDQDDREWIEKLRTKSPQFRTALPALPRTVDTLAHLLSISVGKALPQVRGGASQRGRRRGDIKDLAFRQFVHFLLLVTEQWCGGDLTFDKNYEKGSLLEALKVLRKYLPQGVVPSHLPLMTIQRIKNNREHYTGWPEIEFWRAE